ncbi:MAG TPA: LacI family DNA-binding transcriptional regulator [Thermoanaerobaculia bacterium]|jgi:LacI family transcriptional regulator|nr:LacI family DNA-binding transcriptional regulator [Thermoanaerobaculia bacterium]
MPIPRDARTTRRRSNAAAATIHDVAARAGVSVATVSRVLNGIAVVREETSRDVRAAAKFLRYVPNVAARSLSIRRSQTIGIVLPDVHGEFFSEVIRGIDLAARREGYHILVSGSHSDPGEMLEVVETMRGRVDGLMIMAPDVTLAPIEELRARELPVVLLNAAAGTGDAITIDNFGGARAVMRHLHDLGHTHIAFVCGPLHNADARERLRGYRHAMRGLEPAALRALEFQGAFTEESGFAAGERIAAALPRPTAVFAANDSMAVGALAAFATAGIRVPDSMSVVGFDDIPIARYVAPPLTTMRVDIAELGRRAFALLLSIIINPAAHTARRERVATTLVVRGSCGAPKPQPKQYAQPHRAARGRKRVPEKGEVS